MRSKMKLPSNAAMIQNKEKRQYVRISSQLLYSSSSRPGIVNLSPLLFAFHVFYVFLDNVLRLCSRATSVSTVRVSRKLNLLAAGELKDLLESSANGQEDVAALFVCTALATGNVAIATTRDAFTNGASPDTDAVKSLADVDDNAHDLTVLLILERLANGAHHDLEPETVDINVALLLVLVGPLATVLVLGIFPLGADAGLEQMVVGLEGELRNGGDVVLFVVSCMRRI